MEDLQDSYKCDTWGFPISQFCSYVFANYFPIGSMIYSLMYAMNHKKRMIKRALKQKRTNGSISRGESFHSLLLGEGEEDLTLPKSQADDPLAGVLDLASDSSDEDKQRPYINTSNIAVNPFVMKKQNSKITLGGQRSSSIQSKNDPLY